jgi:hypothetical protein
MKLKEHFQKCAEHHLSCAKAHREASEETYGATSDFHKSMQAIHTDHAAHFVACAKACNSNDNSISDVHVGTEMGGGNPGGPSNKAMPSFGMRAALDVEEGTPAFGMRAVPDLNKVIPSEVHGVVSSQREFIPRAGGPSSPSLVDPTTAIDQLRK